MHRLLYMSSESFPFSSDSLLSILNPSMKRNAVLDVTGLLLYSSGNFLQVLEGPQTVVEDLYGRIRRDARHRGVTILLQGRIPGREFADWSMGFRNLNLESEKMPGFNPILNRTGPSTASLSKEIRVFVRMFESAY